MLIDAFSIQRSGELVAFVGGGGKSSLMFALGRQLAAAGRGVVLTTTTRIATAEVARFPAVCRLARLEQLDALLAQHGCCLVVGDVGPDKAKSVPLELPARLLARPDVDAILVEADGAKMLPVKVPAAHEPALPHGTTLLVPIAGIDALEQPLARIAHRPEQVAAFTGRAPGERLRPADLALILSHPQGGLKNAPAGSRVIPFINKVETDEQQQLALEVARLLLTSARVERVVIGALKSEQAVRAVVTRSP